MLALLSSWSGLLWIAVFSDLHTVLAVQEVEKWKILYLLILSETIKITPLMHRALTGLWPSWIRKLQLTWHLQQMPQCIWSYVLILIFFFSECKWFFRFSLDCKKHNEFHYNSGLKYGRALSNCRYQEMDLTVRLTDQWSTGYQQMHLKKMTFW